MGGRERKKRGKRGEGEGRKEEMVGKGGGDGRRDERRKMEMRIGTK